MILKRFNMYFDHFWIMFSDRKFSFGIWRTEKETSSEQQREEIEMLRKRCHDQGDNIRSLEQNVGTPDHRYFCTHRDLAKGR